MLNEELLNFLANKSNFDTKNELDEEITELLQNFRDELLDLIDSEALKLPIEAKKGRSKVTKGNLHYGYPFQVLDFPSQFDKQNIFTFRTVVWYGHHFSFNLILSGHFLKNHSPKWNKLLNKGFIFTCSENIWKEPLKETDCLEITKNNYTLIQEKTNMCKEIRVSKRYSLNHLSDFHRLGVECFKSIVCSNEDLA